MRRRKEKLNGLSGGIRYDDAVVSVVTAVILIELLFYLFVDFVLVSYIESALTVVGLIVVISVNFVLVRFKLYTPARINIILVTLLQATSTAYVWYGPESGAYLYYFIVIPLAFALFDYVSVRNRVLIAVSVTCAISLFVMNHTTALEIDRMPLSDRIYDGLFFTSSIVSLLGVTLFLLMFAMDVHNKNLSLHELASTDSLTHILNRRSFFEKAEEIYKSSRRSGQEMCMLIFDIDYFKQINDNYGHPAGDSVLRELTEVVGSIIRKDDIFARYGGEEFAVILHKTSVDNGLKVAEEIRHIISAHDFHFSKKETLHMTVSIGVASLQNDLGDLDSIFKAADRALYIAKEEGRDRVVAA